MTFKSRIRRAGAVVSILMGLVILFRAHRAEALEADCKVSKVTFLRPELVVECSNNPNVFILFVNPTAGSTWAACGAPLGDVKIMESMAIAARLSAAPLHIGYSDIVCGGKHKNVIVNTDFPAPSP